MYYIYLNENVKEFRYEPIGVAEIQELGLNKRYMVDIMDIIISEKEFFHNMVFL